MGLISDITDCLRNGSIYALVALTIALIYNTYGAINFVHGEIIMAGIYFISILGYRDILFFYDLIRVFIACGAAVMITRAIYRILQDRPKYYTLIASIAMAFFFHSLHIGYSRNKPILSPLDKISGSTKIFFLELEIENNFLLTILISFALLMIIFYVFRYSRTGRIISAVSENPRSVILSRQHRMTAFFSLDLIVGTILTCVGVLILISFPIVDPYIGTAITMRSIVGAIIGGLGLVDTIPACIPYALMGGFFIGVIETLAKSYISVQASDTIIYLILVIYLLVNHKKYKNKKKYIIDGEILWKA